MPTKKRIRINFIKNNHYQLTLFIFRRDLRLEDNIGLIAALKDSKHVVPCFIFDPRQCENNSYKNLPCIQFMIESLKDLQHQLQRKHGELFLFYGIAEEIVGKILKHTKIDAVYFNRDYTPFSLRRDQRIAAICKKHKVFLHSFDDLLLNPPETTLKSDGNPYKVFTPFYQNARNISIPLVQKNPYRNYYKGVITFSEGTELYQQILPKSDQCDPNLLQGGRKACLKILKKLSEIKNYERDHNYPALEATSNLSPHIKFNTCSIREIYYAIQLHLAAPESMHRQLYWRDFFTSIAFYYPKVFGHTYQKKYDKVPWTNNKKFFIAWCEGKTGFPIVDAGMRQLNQTGFMHNRARLITASFLTKDLHVDWRWGEKYFAQKLIDYDPAVNNGNWQWVAGTGVDAQPYFRIFNPWLQQKNFDPDCIYIKKWIPELKSLPPKMIHQWYNGKCRSLASDYPTPIVCHTIEAKISKKIYSTGLK